MRGIPRYTLVWGACYTLGARYLSKNTVVCSQLCRSALYALRHPSPPLVCFDSSVCTYLSHKPQAVPPLCKRGCTPSVFSVLLLSAETL